MVRLAVAGGLVKCRRRSMLQIDERNVQGMKPDESSDTEIAQAADQERGILAGTLEWRRRGPDHVLGAGA